MQTKESKENKRKGYYFGSALHHALTKGINDYGEDTTERKKFISENQHFFAGVMLVAMFSYLDSTLGNKWIERHGGLQKRELECLRIIRNAFVHTNSNITELESTSSADIKMVREFINDLSNQKIKDDKGNTYPIYMTISAEGAVELNSEALIIFRSMMKVISH